MAIQVNGTTVIDNSRQLTNIASVDSTTKSAIESAGVGGKTTLITDSNISSGTSSVSINFTGGYKYYRVHITDGTHGAGGGSQFSYVARLTNSSGSTITGSATYNFAYRRISDSGGGSTNDADKFIIGDNSWVAGTKASLIIDIMDPYSTSLATMYYGFLQIGTNTQYSESSYMVEGHRTSGPERNNSMNIFFSTPYGTTTTNFTGGRLTVWGVNV